MFPSRGGTGTGSSVSLDFSEVSSSLEILDFSDSLKSLDSLVSSVFSTFLTDCIAPTRVPPVRDFPKNCSSGHRPNNLIVKLVKLSVFIITSLIYHTFEYTKLILKG